MVLCGSENSRGSVNELSEGHRDKNRTAGQFYISKSANKEIQALTYAAGGSSLKVCVRLCGSVAKQ